MLDSRVGYRYRHCRQGRHVSGIEVQGSFFPGGGASACRCRGLDHMARYCTAVKKEKKESGKAQDQEKAVALLVHMENGKEEGIMCQLRKSDLVDITRLYV